MKSTKEILKGYIQLKRKRFWVMRHAILYEDRLTYTENECDIDIRGEYYLSQLDITEVNDKDQKLIQITKKKTDEVLLIGAKQQHTKWYRKLMMCKQKIMQERGEQWLDPQANKIIKAIPQANQSNNTSNNTEECADEWHKNRINTNPDFIVRDSNDIKYHYNKGYYLIDKNLIKVEDNNTLIKDGFGVLSLFDTDSKYLVNAFPNFTVYQLGKESPTKQGFSQKMNKGFLLLKDVIFEKFIAKVFALAGIYLLFYFQIMIPFYISFFAFYVLFFKGRMIEILHRIHQNDYDFYLYGYFKANINEFLKYLKIKEGEKSILQKSTYKDKKVFLQLKDSNTNTKYVVVCSLQIFDYDGFIIQLMLRGSKTSYKSVVDFFSTCQKELKQMRKDPSSQLYSYYEQNKKTIFDGIHNASKYIQPQILDNHNAIPNLLNTKNKINLQQGQLQRQSGNNSLPYKIILVDPKQNDSNRQSQPKEIQINKGQTNLLQKEQANSHQIQDNKIQSQENQIQSQENQTQSQDNQNQSQANLLKINGNEIESQKVELSEKQKGYQAKLKILSDTMIKLQELNSENNWKQVDKDKHIIVHTKFNEEKGLVYCRGECKIPCSVSELETFLFDVQSQKHFNSYFDYGEVVEKIADDMQVIYSITRKIAIVSPRDVLALQGIVKQGDNTIICCESVYDVQRPPHKKDAVRVDLFIGGFMLQSVSPTVTNCIYVVCSDPKGKIPQWVKNMGMKDQAYTPNLIRKYFEKKNSGR